VLVHERDNHVDECTGRLDHELDLIVVVRSAARGVIDGPHAKHDHERSAQVGIASSQAQGEAEPSGSVAGEASLSGDEAPDERPEVANSR